MERTNRPAIIVLVPVRNESWFLKLFLESASLWADHIIVADQSSEDDSRDIAAAFPNVTVIENPEAQYSEVARQRLLIAAARQRFPGPRILVAIDADEIFSATILDSSEWQASLSQPPGTILEFARVDLYDSADRYYLNTVEDKQLWCTFAYVDDGAPHEGGVLHTRRLPEPAGAPRLHIRDVVLLHFAQVNRRRAESKDRWYRCFERVTSPGKNILTLHRQYDFYERLHSRFNIRETPARWLSRYRDAGFDFDVNVSNADLWWDWEILRMFKTHGTAPFRHLDIWSVDWEARRLEGLACGIRGLPEEPIHVPDGLRDRLIRAILRWPHARGLVDRVMWRLFRYLPGLTASTARESATASSARIRRNRA